MPRHILSVSILVFFLVVVWFSARGDQASNGVISFKPASFTGERSKLVGRFVKTSENLVSFSWPGSKLEFQFEGSEAAIAMASDSKVRFEVEVDWWES